MNYLFKLRLKRAALTIILSINISLLLSIKLPVFLDWRSSNSYAYYGLDENDISAMNELYKVRVGIDTLFNNGIGIKVALTNQEERLFSQTVFDYAIINYRYNKASVQLSMKDYGYGKNFLLYNRRFDNPWYGRNALFEYRWHGLEISYDAGKNRLTAGIGGNEINQFICHADYNFKPDYLELNLFTVYAQEDNQYTTDIYNVGSEFLIDNNFLSLQSCFSYNYLPESKHHPEMDYWHVINELAIVFVPQIKLSLSSDHQTYAKNNKTDYLYEGCLSFSIKRWQNNIGVRKQTIPLEKVYTYFADVNYTLVKNLEIGLFSDYNNLTISKDYLKIGFQARYTLK